MPSPSCVLVLSAVASLAGPVLGAPVAFNVNPHPGKPKVTFSRDGSFRLVVFSDLHFGENPWDWWGPEHDAASVNLIRKVLADERPDYAYVGLFSGFVAG